MNLAVNAQFHGQLLHNEPMSRHCSWRTGGKAELYFEPVDKQDLVAFLATLTNEVAVTWIGLGSNLLVRDGGLRGVVIAVLSHLKQLKLLDNGLVYAECGVTCARLARFCQQHNLADADFLAGIPGTVGGALAMNAGAFGHETWQFVDCVEMMNRHGELIKRKHNQFEVSYRSVVQNETDNTGNEWFAAGYFRFPEKTDQQPSNIKELLEKRNVTQPVGLPSCGSVFKNPRGDHSARLIEECGLKGLCIGGACVSDKHANFIINANQATAADIEDLIIEIQHRVKLKFNIELQTEVRIMGDRL